MNFLSSVSEHFDSVLRRVVPYSLMILLLLLGSVSVPVAGTGDIKAPFFLMAVYYWSIYRPRFIPAWMACMAGVAADLLGDLPLGLSALTFVLAQWLVSDQRRFLTGQSFAVVWVGFGLVSLGFGFLQWMLYGLLERGAWTPLEPVLFSALLGFAVFPLVCLTLHWTHRLLPSS